MHHEHYHIRLSAQHIWHQDTALVATSFGGLTSFGAMVQHMPNGGSYLVVYGPHVGVDRKGKIETIDRRGRAKGGASCGSAVAASGGYVQQVLSGEIKDEGPPSDLFGCSAVIC